MLSPLLPLCYNDRCVAVATSGSNPTYRNHQHQTLLDGFNKVNYATSATQSSVGMSRGSFSSRS